MNSSTETPWPSARDPRFPQLPETGSQVGKRFIGFSTAFTGDAEPVSPGGFPRETAGEVTPGLATVLAAFREAWLASRKTLTELSQRLGEAQLPEDIVSIAVCGSLGRMEQRADSDCDLIVLVSRPLDDAAGTRLREAVAAATRGLFSRDSSLDGIFSQPVPVSDLLDPARRGRLAEDLPTFGTRMQLLIDSQPVLHPGRYADTVRQVLEWYCEDEAAAGFLPPWHYLLNDLLRYHRALAIRYQWGWRDDLSRWRLLKVKETHSRLLNIAGLLLLLGRFSSQLAEPPVAADEAGSALDSLEDHLRLTPLERVTGTLAGTAGSRAARVLAAAGQLSAWLADPAWVKELTEGSGPELAASPLLDTARTAGRQIRAEVAGFLRDQHGSWPEEFLDAVML